MSEQLRTIPWYDRNAESKADHYIVAETIPHESSSRLTYTCPKGKQAMIELLIARVTRITAATTPRIAAAEWKMIPKGGVFKYILPAWLTEAQNDPKDTDKMGLAGTINLFEGDYIRGLTYDTSEDGTCHYFLCYKLTEFDAYPIEKAPFEVELPEKDLQEPEEKPWWWPF